MRALYARNIYNPAKMELESIQRIYDSIGRPMEGMPIVHVAGTNGKGSVCFKMSQLLNTCGLKTGLFVSPHISSYRERVVVDGRIMTEEDVIRGIGGLNKICNELELPATVFEMTTALGFKTFGASLCDVVVLEVGLGGRLDATNIITPSLSIISSIQLDHTRVLGDTVEQIAREKAGIIKPNVPVLIGPGCPVDVIQDIADKQGAPLYQLKDVLGAQAAIRSVMRDGVTVDTDMLNSDIARAAALLLEDSLAHSGDRAEKVSTAITRTRIQRPGDFERALKMRSPCRFEAFKAEDKRPGFEGSEVDVVLDIAHNVDAVRALMAKTMRTYGNKNPANAPCEVHVVLGLSRDKDMGTIVKEILHLNKDYTSVLSSLTAVAAQHPRAREPAQIMTHAAALLPPENTTLCVDSGEDVATGVRGAIERAVACRKAGGRSVVLCFGSAFIMSSVRQELGVDEPTDDLSLNSELRNDSPEDAEDSHKA